MAGALKVRNESDKSRMSRLQRSINPVRSYPGALPQAVAFRAFGACGSVSTTFSSILLSFLLQSSVTTTGHPFYLSSKKTLRVVGMDKKLDLQRIADVIRDDRKLTVCPYCAVFFSAPLMLRKARHT